MSVFRCCWVEGTFLVSAQEREREKIETVAICKMQAARQELRSNSQSFGESCVIRKVENRFPVSVFKEALVLEQR